MADAEPRTAATEEAGAAGGGDEVDGAPGTSPRASTWLTERLPVWLFAAGVVATVPLVLFHFGEHQWFLADEWVVLTDHEGFPPLFDPSAGAHLILVPRLVYRAFWELWGVTTYRPYALANLTAHVIAVSMLWIIMRRSAVVPWLATAAAGIMLLFGPGHEGIVLAFQIGFTGSLAWGLVQLVLADHDGGFGRRDVLALGFGLLAIASSGVAVTMAGVVGLALLLRRGWRPALLHSVPLLLLYGLWMVVKDVDTSPAASRPSIGLLLRWVRETSVDTLKGVAHFELVAVLLVVIVAVATVLVLGPWRDRGRGDLRRELAMPVAMAVGMVFFAAATGMGRAWAGLDRASSSRYIYLQAALLLPLFAVAAQVLCRRWRALTPVLVVLFLVPLVFNLGDFGTSPFNRRPFFEGRRYILTTAVRMPFADEVPRGVRPVPDRFDSEGLNIGFLLDAERSGKLNPSTVALTPEAVNEFRIRLGVAQWPTTPGLFPSACETITDRHDLAPRKGAEFMFLQPIQVMTIDRAGGRQTSRPVSFDPFLNGNRFTVELPDLQLRIRPARGQRAASLCPLN